MPRTSEGPKYVQIKNAILREIRTGKLAPGSQVYSISQIMETFHVSKVTAVRALAELEGEGVVRREHGRGTFVAPAERFNARTRPRKSVAVIVPNMANPFHAEIVGALEKRLRDSDASVELTCTDYDVATEQAAFERLSAHAHVAGAVLISIPKPHDLSLGSGPRVPLIVVDYCPPDLQGRCVFISCDNFRGGYDAAIHLTSLGHRRIGYINQMHGSQDRMQGFKRGLEDCGLPLPPSQILEREFGQPVGDELIDIVRRKHLTGIFAHNDMLAMQAMQILRAGGYRVPEDISLIGYDHVEAGRYLEVPLTTIDQHEGLIGRKAADCLLESLDAKANGMKPREIVFVPQLVVRASTAPPKEG